MIEGCVDYGLLHKIGGSMVALAGKTKLDKERTSLCLTEIVCFGYLLIFTSFIHHKDNHFLRRTLVSQQDSGGCKQPQEMSEKSTEEQ